MAEEVFDVVMQATGAFESDVYEYQRNRPPEANFELGPDLWVGFLPLKIDSDFVFDACGPAGYKFRPSRQFGCRYSICRKVGPDQPNYYQWDSDGWLRRTLFISRLIRPTTIGKNLSAKLYFNDDKLQMIVPGAVQEVGAMAWVVAHPQWRDWLSVGEFVTLRESIAKYNLTPPDRVRQARKHMDNAFHSFYLDQRCASIVTAFESLLKISPYQATKQFTSRAPRLAKLLDLEITDQEAKALYDDRSAFVHGTQVSFTDLNDELIIQYNRFEQVLRHCLLKASTDPAFAALFSSDQSVEGNFGN